MRTTILISPPASGKTEHCIRKVHGALQAAPLAPVWIVVPDRLQVAAFRRRLAIAGGAIGAHVATFEGLYREILRQAGRRIPTASGAVVHRLIRTAILEVDGGGGLPHYHAIAATPGFLTVLQDRIAELKRAQVHPRVFADLAGHRGRRLSELADLFAAYQSRLEALGWADAPGLNWAACKALERDTALCARWPLLVVDGFDSFDGSQLEALRLLADRLPELIITQPGGRDRSRAAHRRFARSVERLCRAIPGAKLDYLPPRPYLPSPLAKMERYLFEAGARRFMPEGAVQMLSTRTQAGEAREALRWLKACVQRRGVPLEGCALIIPDPATYGPHLREAAREFGIPLRFTAGDPLLTSPAIAALLDLLELPNQDWPRRLTLEAIRTPYFDLSKFDLVPQTAQALEDVSLKGQVVQGLSQWREALERLAAAEASMEAAQDEDLRLPNLPRGAVAAEIWRGLSAFARRIEPPGEQDTIRWVRWLEDLLQDIGFFKRCELPPEKAAALAFRQTLRALVLGERVGGELDMDLRGFLVELKSALEAARYEPPLVWHQAAVQVLRLLEARGLRFRAVAVLGLAEGLFPQVEREDPFLEEEVRAALGLEPRLGREQGGLFYQALTRADRYLLLTRPYLAEDGERWEPSPFWRAAQSLLAEEPQMIRPEKPRPLAEAASSQELLFWGVRRKALPESYLRRLMPRWVALRRAGDILASRQAAQPRGAYEGDLSNLSSQMKQRYGPDHVWSASRLEQYGTCPFFFYSASALGLDSREIPEPGYDAAQLGSMLHAILERTYRWAGDPGNPQSVLQNLKEVSREVFETAPERYGFRPTALWRIEKEQLTEALQETIRALHEANGGWRPIAFEAPFGFRDQPALICDTDAGRISLHGFIDRVDQDAQGELRIIDYKTGSSGLTGRDFVEGRRLQLPLYALAARDALRMGVPVEGFYWKLLAAEPSQFRLGKFYSREGGARLQGPQGAFQLVRAHVGKIVEGVRNGRFPPSPPAKGCPHYCPAAGWCWRFSPGRW